MTLSATEERSSPMTIAMKLSEIQKVKHLAKRRDTSVSELIRKLISEEISKEKDAA
jgi:macrodomain Ter protein organizer (MatP/YcbG family)